jgi:hypothetical protein
MADPTSGDTSRRVLTIMVAVFLLAIVLSAAVYALMSSDTALLPFLITFCIACAAVSVYRLVEMGKLSTKMDTAQKELAKIKPVGCPDYWTSAYNCSNGTMACQPYFDGDDGRMFISDKARDPVSPSATTDSVCTAEAINKEGGYPWMEVRNSCEVRAHMG